MRKPNLGQAKRQGGLSLIPALWEEIDRVAKLAGVPRNQVIETALMREFLPEWDSRFSSNSVHSTHEELVALP